MNQLASGILTPIDIGTFSIPTYIINLKKRADRKAHVLEQFAGRDEFALTVVEAFEHSFGALGLWMTIRYILQDLAPTEAEYIIICEDDIEFTEHYSKDNLFKAINDAKECEVDVLLGGVSWFDETVQVKENIFWTNNFTGLHFAILFKKFHKIILETKLKNYSAADFQIGMLTNSTLFIHPFMAVQKEFGYSDATGRNNVDGRVQSLFSYADRWAANLKKVSALYSNLPQDEEAPLADIGYDNVTIPTYVINLPERTDRLEHIKKEFKEKPEFDVQIIEACKHEVGALGLWLTIRKIIELAIVNDDEVIVICEDDHKFTEAYTKEYLIKNILEAHEHGVCILSGGTGKFNNAIPITQNRFWVRHCLSSQFVVIYNHFFRQILEEPYNEKIVADLAYSHMTSNKMVLYPFISTQKDFGYSDITDAHKTDKNLVTNMFIQSDKKFKRIQDAYIKYHPKKSTIQSFEKYD